MYFDVFNTLFLAHGSGEDFQMLSMYYHYFAIIKEVCLHLITIESLYLRMIWTSLVEIGLVVLEKIKIKKCNDATITTFGSGEKLSD